jgi:hypothetical protein
VNVGFAGTSAAADNAKANHVNATANFEYVAKCIVMTS